MTEVAEKASSSLDQESLRVEHPVSLTYPAIAVPSSPCRPGSSITIGGYFESLLTEKQTCRTGKECTKGGRCTYIFYTDSLH